MTEAEFIEIIHSQQKHIAFLENTIANLNANIEQLLDEISELKETLNKNSTNSSKPPSSDGLARPKTRSLRQKSGKKPGGQKGHKGVTIKVPEKADIVIEHYPEECSHCHLFGKCKGKFCRQQASRYVTDIKIAKEVTEHITMRIERCPLHGGALGGAFPEGVSARVQYGTTIETFVVNQSMDGTGADKISRTARNFFGLESFSTGSVINMIESCASKLEGAERFIKQQLVNSTVNHYDETGVNVNGKLNWTHSASNLLFTLLVLSRKRGAAGMEELGVIGKQHGVAVHDCWEPYWKFGNVAHALCCVHLLRELNGVIENHPEQEWAPKFKTLLEELYRLKKSYDSCGRPMEECYRIYYGYMYDSLIGIAKKENPLPEISGKRRGRRKKGKVRSLIDRLESHKESVLLFTTSCDIPFSNNAAEQTVRNLKVKTKIAGCFRSEAGAKAYLRLRSYIDSARKHGFDACQAIRLAFEGSPCLCLGC